MDPLPCPRCGGAFEADDYGPCPSCIAALRATQRREPESVAATAFEPRMHVTPNAVATKE